MEELFKSDKILQFWPSDKQTPKERAYATTRFILYASCIIYLIRRDVRILLVGGLALFAVYYMYKNGMIKDTEYKYVKKASNGNVMNNGLDGPQTELIGYFLCDFLGALRRLKAGRSSLEISMAST